MRRAGGARNPLGGGQRGAVRDARSGGRRGVRGCALDDGCPLSLRPGSVRHLGREAGSLLSRRERGSARGRSPLAGVRGAAPIGHSPSCVARSASPRRGPWVKGSGGFAPAVGYGEAAVAAEGLGGDLGARGVLAAFVLGQVDQADDPGDQVGVMPGGDEFARAYVLLVV